MRQLRHGFSLRGKAYRFRLWIQRSARQTYEDQQTQHELVREMLAMFVRTFLRHTPAVRPEHKDAAWDSAANRFEVFLDALAKNRRDRRSVMDPAPGQETAH
jgi:hypothetical protein